MEAYESRLLACSHNGLSAVGMERCVIHSRAIAIKEII